MRHYVLFSERGGFVRQAADMQYVQKLAVPVGLGAKAAQRHSDTCVQLVLLLPPSN